LLFVVTSQAVTVATVVLVSLLYGTAMYVCYNGTYLSQ
jgi:hypothetical protein